MGEGCALVIGTTLFGVASLVCALSPSLEVLLAARGAQGIGAAFLLPNSLAILNASFEGEARGRAIGIWAAASAIAAAIAPLIGGWLVDHVGWPAIFYINLPLAAGAIALALIFVAESRDRSAGRTDYAGAVLVTAGLGGLTYALTRWSSSAVFDSVAAVAIALGGVLLVGFVFVEKRRRDKAMIPLAMFADRCFAGLNLLTFLLYGAFGAAMLLVPYVLISSAGYSPVQAGLALLPLPIILACGSPAMGKLAIRIGPRLPLTVGPLVVAGGMLLGVRIGVDTAYWTAAFPSIARARARNGDRRRAADRIGARSGQAGAHRNGVGLQQCRRPRRGPDRYGPARRGPAAERRGADGRLPPGAGRLRGRLRGGERRRADDARQGENEKTA